MIDTIFEKAGAYCFFFLRNGLVLMFSHTIRPGSPLTYSHLAIPGALVSCNALMECPTNLLPEISFPCPVSLDN